ncbi:MAG: pilus (MSHA type) biogenesis protein MshL [Candidatus Brocadiaceae bacterium]|nr:pilus (MSHA type) biogenesis protein MshL [Candidatus Brocadiaceae bacterium]
MDKNRVVDKWILTADALDNVADRRRIKSRLPLTNTLFVKGLLGAVSCLPFLILLSSCSYMDIKREVQIPEEYKEVKAEQPPSELKIPEFTPITEDISPLKVRIVDIVARNTPLRDVLHVVAEATSLNLVMDKWVNPETPITLTLKNISAEEALNIIFSSVDYFYAVKDNILFVKAVDSRIFELGHPAIVQNYESAVGGDILGGALGGTTGGTSGGSNIRGNIIQNAKSDTVAFNFWEAIENSIVSILGITGEQTTGAAGSTTMQRVNVNRLPGTIVVTATKRNMERVEEYLNTIKRVMNRQVLVEAKIIEVQLSDRLQFGIDWSSVTHILGSTVNFSTTKFNTISPSGSIFSSIGVTKGDNFSAVLNALKEQGELRTLSNPRVNIMNGQTSLLSVGRNENFVSKVETTTVAGVTPITTFTVTTSSVLSGIIIGIVPYINEIGEITLTITPIVSDLVGDFKTAEFGPNDEIKISLPTIDLRELSTTVKVRDGQLIIIGGLIQKDENLQKNKVPLLGDIPYLGELFTKRDKEESKTELVVILQPQLVSR